MVIEKTLGYWQCCFVCQSFVPCYAASTRCLCDSKAAIFWTLTVRLQPQSMIKYVRMAYLSPFTRSVLGLTQCSAVYLAQ